MSWNPLSGAAMAGTMVDQKADARPRPWPDQARLVQNWKPGLHSWLLVALGVAVAIAVLALLIWLP